MTQDDFDDRQLEIPAREPRRPAGHGRLVAAGVVGALTLGVGLGLWARPAPPPQAQPAGKPVAPEDAPRPALQIVMDDTPAPIGPLLEVLPGEAAEDHTPSTAAPAAVPEPVAPRRPAAGLMKVDAVVAAAPLLVPAVRVEEKSRPKAEPKPEPKPTRTETLKAEKARTDKARAEVARIERLKVAEAKAKKAEKAQKAKAVKLAKAEPRKAKAEKAEPKRLAKLVKAVKAAPKTLKAEVAKKKATIQMAKVSPAKKPAVQKASTRPAPKPAKAPAPPRKPILRGEGPMRVARNDVCASPDPGEAAVCADRGLTARDRQMQQAYRNAEAAGVPASALRRQQTRWLQARAAAAREAPWAVEDVYTARISELNDLTRDAREN